LMQSLKATPGAYATRLATDAESNSGRLRDPARQDR
jgi:hypothetical protein